MKKSILFLSFVAGSVLGFAQHSNNNRPVINTSFSPEVKNPGNKNYSLNTPKTIVCNDTIRYGEAKELVLGAPVTWNSIDIWEGDNEAISHAFLNPGTVTVNGVEFYGANSSDFGTLTNQVRASIYNVNASFVPTTLITSGTITLLNDDEGYYYVNFASPATVTGNYAIVIDMLTPDAVLLLLTNNRANNQSYDEFFAKAKSSYYASSNGAYVNIPVYTVSGFTGGPFNFEPAIAPIVSYNINTQFTPSATTVCQGTPVTFTNASTPSNYNSANNRMNNFQSFKSYFLSVLDSTYVYDMDNASPLIWNGTTTYTHPTAGTYDVLLATRGGLFNSCFDFSTQTITVNTAPAAPTVTPGGPTTFCAGGSVTLTSSAATGNTWSNGATTPSITVSAAGTYTVTATALGCTSPASAGQMITVTALDNAAYTYPTNAICDMSPNQTPTTAVAGSFSATPAGLVFASTSTGEINVAGSTAGTYSVTYTTTGTCPNTSTQTVVISGAPDAAFTYAQSIYCTNGTDPSPVYGAGASAGAFSSTTGLVVNASTGAINLASSSAGTYTVTNAIAANGSCPADIKTFNVTIAATPTAAVSGGGTQCGTGSFPVNVALTGTGPWDITYSDGTTTSNAAGITTSPYVINATANGTYTVSAVTMGGCTAAGTGTATVVFHTNPTVTFTPVGNLCDNATAVTLVGSPAGGMFSGSTGVSGSTFDPSGLTPGSVTLTYNFTDANNCSGSATSTFTINAAPTATLGTFTDVCLQASAFALTGGLPAGGTYSGTGVTGGNFNPATAGAGSQTITYTVNANGCSDAISQNIIVEDCAGIEEMTNFGLEIYPNPASSTVTIKTGKDVTFSMISEDGKMVYPVSSLSMNTETQLEVSHLAKGVYFLQFNGAQGNLVQKVIVK